MKTFIVVSIAITLAVVFAVSAADVSVISSFSLHPGITFAVAGALPQLGEERLIPDPVVARDWLGVCLRTLARWDANPSTGFPAAIRINGRKFRRASELIAFMRASAVAHVSSDRRTVHNES